MRNIAIFASGSGSNAENIINFLFDKKEEISVEVIMCNNPDAYVIERADRLNIPCITFNREDTKNGNVLRTLKDKNIDFIVLAGYLWLIPKDIISHYDGKIINIHPALLPAYGGKGMYGDNVHNAVHKAKEIKSGITIHYVNEKFDDGDIIFQHECELTSEDTPQTIASKVHELEHEYFPKVIIETVNKIK